VTPPRFGIVGWKNSGKTTLTARLVGHLSARGLTVATVKRAHAGFDVDHPGTDSHAHREAGAREVAIVSSKRWALMHENASDEDELELDHIIARLSPCDVVLIERFSAAPHPTIEMRLAGETHTPKFEDSDPSIIALAYDEVPSDAHRLPVFHRDDIPHIADRVLVCCGLEQYREPP